MSCLKNVLYVLIVAAVPVWAAAEFPTAPVDARAAELRGLQRLDVPALKHVFSGVHLEQNAKGKVYRVEYGADGSVILSNTSGLIDRGTFSITRQNGGGVCLRLEQQMNQQMDENEKVWRSCEWGACVKIRQTACNFRTSMYTTIDGYMVYMEFSSLFMYTKNYINVNHASRRMAC